MYTCTPSLHRFGAETAQCIPAKLGFRARIASKNDEKKKKRKKRQRCLQLRSLRALQASSVKARVNVRALKRSVYKAVYIGEHNNGANNHHNRLGAGEHDR